MPALGIHLRPESGPIPSPAPKDVPRSINRPLADDIATIIQSLNDLSTLKTNYDLFEDVSGLGLKIKKCSLIPLRIDPTPDWLNKIPKAIKQIVPDWSNFSVVLSAKYLSFMIGPTGGSTACWGKPLSKYIDRSISSPTPTLPPHLVLIYTPNGSHRR